MMEIQLCAKCKRQLVLLCPSCDLELIDSSMERAGAEQARRADENQAWAQEEQRKREATEADRAALLGIVKELRGVLFAAQQHLEYCGYGDSWERECAEDEKLPEKIETVLVRADTVLAGKPQPGGEEEI